eukprot:gene18332-biopygen18920
MLRCYVAENQEDWDLCVTPVEYAIADSVSAATGYSPFELVYGNAPATQLDVFMDAALEGGSKRRNGGCAAAGTRGSADTSWRSSLHSSCMQRGRVSLQMTPQRMIGQFDARHRLPQMKVNDQVWGDGQHLTLPGDRGLKPTLRKLRHEPLRIMKCSYSDRQQELPEQVRCGLGEPSSEQSKAKISGTPDFELADRRVLQRTRQIIEYCDPAYYFIRRTLLETRYEDCTREQ